MFPIVVNKSAPSSSQLPDWSLPASLDISYSKGGGLQFSKLFDIRIKDFSASHGSGQLKIIFSVTSFLPATNALGDDFQLDTPAILQMSDFGKLFNLHLDFLQINLLLAGVYTGNLNIQVLQVSDNMLISEKVIPINLTVVDSGEITNNLSTELNFCLDEDLFFKLNSTVAKFVKVAYAIHFKGKTHNVEYQYALMDNEVSIPIGVPIQPYIYLSDEDIAVFFGTYMLDMKPANVEIDVFFLDENYQQITHYQLGSFLFHAGYSRNIPENGKMIERSLSFNSFLPLAYRFPGNNIIFSYKGFTKFFNKQQFSTPTSIFQTMLIQKYHYNGVVEGGFSPGFSSGFLTTEAIMNADPFFLYEEGYINYVSSSYNIMGINFPWQINSWNIIWLNENNNFCGMCFTGDRSKERQIQHIINQASKDFRHKKAGTIRDSKMKINSGWKLSSEIPIFNSLIDAKRAWIFKNNPSERVEIVCTSDKFPEEIAGRELVEFELEFIIND